MMTATKIGESTNQLSHESNEAMMQDDSYLEWFWMLQTPSQPRPIGLEMLHLAQQETHPSPPTGLPANDTTSEERAGNNYLEWFSTLQITSTQGMPGLQMLHSAVEDDAASPQVMWVPTCPNGRPPCCKSTWTPCILLSAREGSSCCGHKSGHGHS